ncbi:MAG: hypothetical protein Q7T82_01180 [Armatimonadota bacterium]|nr:hypothetical protein [Armatimonadota bacterium]
MRSKWVRVSKIATVESARRGLEKLAAVTAEQPTMPKEQPEIPEHELPVGYEIEGRFVDAPVPGGNFVVLRHRRHGIPALGLFGSTPVREVLVVTRNSTAWWLRRLLER